MFHQQQLERVAVQFAPEIATLQEFYRTADTPLDSVGAVALQLHRDPAFRRDLGSHLLLIHHAHSARVGASQLLSMVAVAAAGATGAATSGEDDTHAVLRFILAVTEPQKNTAHVAQPVATVPVTTGQPRWMWAGALCLLLAAALGLAVFRHHTPTQRLPEAPSSTQASLEAAPAQENDVTAAPTGQAPEPRRSANLSPQAHSHAARNARLTPESTAAVLGSKPTTVQDQHQALATAIAHVASAARASGETLSQVRPTQTHTDSGAITTSGTSAAVPSAVLSQRLDARRLPLVDGVETTSSGRAYPHLLRRHPLAAVQTESGGGEGTLLASNGPAPRVGAPYGTTTSASAGTVRPVSLGIMAGNVLYSPAPVYPPAAAAAHVQGAVTIQAEIDRDGSVASARVVSGPPLLRDAALDAVQRWRYRPRMVAGRASTAAATAVMEFALP